MLTTKKRQGEETMSSQLGLRLEGYKPEGRCEYSDKEGEVVQVIAEDGSICGFVSFAELSRMIRFRARMLENRQAQVAE